MPSKSLPAWDKPMNLCATVQKYGRERCLLRFCKRVEVVGLEQLIASADRTCMPKKKHVHSLERLCLENVARNMEHVWVRDCTTDTHLRRDHCRYSVGPFSVLAGVLVQELIQWMRERKLLTSSVLCSLLLPQLQELHLTMCPNLVSEPMAHIIAVRCKNLSSLDLRGCSQIPANALADLVKGLPCLIKLDLAETQCDTKVLWALGSSCFRLRQLDITACERLTPDSLIHLAYNPVSRSFHSSALQILEMCGLESHLDKPDMLWALVFVLLALPNLKYIIHDSVTKAVCLIYHQQFDRAWVVPGFPSLKEVALHRRSASMREGTPGLTLALREIYGVNESSWPMACAVCPHLEEASFFLTEGFNLAQTFLTCHHLVRLTINCSPRRNLGDLLSVTSVLGARLQSLSLDGFFLEDRSVFHTLLTHCQNLQTFRVILFPAENGDHGRWAGDESSACYFALPPLDFPHLRDLSLMYSNTEHPPHATALRKSLISLLRHSPCLEILDLMCLPFPLDEVFQKALAPPGTALQQLSELSLIQDEVSARTVGLLLSSENKLSYLRLEMCSGIHPVDYEEVKQRISREGLDVHLVWE